MEINQLSEVKAHKNPNCKWYRNGILDLTVEFTLSGQIKSFHLDYNERSPALSIQWVDFKLKNYVFDDGEQDPKKNQSPIATAELTVMPEVVKRKFEMYSKDVPEDIRQFVLNKI